MENKEKVITTAVFVAIDNYNEQSEDDSILAKSLETDLTGLDSLQLVNLIIEVENAIESELNKVISLTDEDVLSPETTPFVTVRKLVTYISSRI